MRTYSNKRVTIARGSWPGDTCAARKCYGLVMDLNKTTSAAHDATQSKIAPHPDWLAGGSFVNAAVQIWDEPHDEW